MEVSCLSLLNEFFPASRGKYKSIRPPAGLETQVNGVFQISSEQGLVQEPLCTWNYELEQVKLVPVWRKIKIPKQQDLLSSVEI